jgi:hypothetical protein
MKLGCDCRTRRRLVCKESKRKGESEIKWYVIAAMHPLKTGSHCGDTKAKIAAQLVHDEIGYKNFSSCYQYVGKWCKDASSNESKSTLIEHKGKMWQLRIVDKKPEPVILLLTGHKNLRMFLMLLSVFRDLSDCNLDTFIFHFLTFSL